MAAWLRAMRWPLVLAAANFWITPLSSFLVGVAAATVAFNVLRVVLMVWAGWHVATRAGARTLGAAFAGIAIMIVDHVLLKGGTFLFLHVRGDPAASYTRGGVEHAGSYLKAFGGVLVSFVMFCPFAGLAGAAGGWMGRKRGAGASA